MCILMDNIKLGFIDDVEKGLTATLESRLY